MTFCTRCGKQSQSGDEYCSGCGLKLRLLESSGTPSSVRVEDVTGGSLPRSSASDQVDSMSPSAEPPHHASPPLPLKSTSNRRLKLGIALLVVVLVVALIIGLAVIKHSGSEGGNSQAYIAGWNEIAPADIEATFVGSTSNLYVVTIQHEPQGSIGSMYNNCREAYQTDGSGWNETQWLQGCNGALSSLAQARSANGTSATIPKR